MKKSFKNLAELQSGIGELQILRFNQEQEIKVKFSSPSATFSTVVSLFKNGSADKKTAYGNLLNHDLVPGIARIILPFILNSIVFRRSGFITKAIVTFLSRKAAKNVNTDVVAGLVDKVKNLFKNHKKDHQNINKRAIRDYGIPPDSETY